MKKRNTVRLKQGRVKPVWLGHPWVYAEAIQSMDDSSEDGDLVQVVDPQGNRLGVGTYNSRSAIPVRILSTDPDAPIDGAFFARRIRSAMALRKDLLDLPSEETNGYRLINTEGDLLPGLVVDVFAGTAAIQFTTLGMKRQQDVIVGALLETLNPSAIVEVASGGPATSIEGVISVPRVIHGDPALVSEQFMEGGARFAISLPGGQKTGFYLDQRQNRTTVSRLCQGKRVLDGYCFVGAFGIRAAVQGAAQVTGVDSSAPSLACAAQNAALNQVSSITEWVHADVLRYLRNGAEEGRRWDVVILDPPKFAHKRGDVPRALPTYRRINAAGMAVLQKGGILSTSSCSGSIAEDDFIRVLSEAARDAGRRVQVLAISGAAPDHPIRLPCTEGRYLKSVLCRVV